VNTPNIVKNCRHLRLSNNKCREMFEEYHQVDDAVCRIEEEIELFATDRALTN